MKTGTALHSKGEIKILHAVAGRVRLGFVDSPTKEVTNTVIKQLRQQEEKVIYQIVHSRGSGGVVDFASCGGRKYRPSCLTHSATRHGNNRRATSYQY
jgi:hypothetical protein